VCARARARARNMLAAIFYQSITGALFKSAL